MIRACARPRAAGSPRVEGVRMLLKPVDPDELLAELRRLLEGPRL